VVLLIIACLKKPAPKKGDKASNSDAKSGIPTIDTTENMAPEEIDELKKQVNRNSL